MDQLVSNRSFNEAATVRLRKWQSHIWTECGWDGPFNEAATVRLRKCVRARTCTALGCRPFNEAATVRLRKSNVNQVTKYAYTVPSMRPQPLGCGNVDPAYLDRHRPQSFNEAATVRLRKLQVHPPRPRVCRPSMRPQPLGCGNYNHEAEITVVAGPSMRPQPLGCGNA